jgi:hypothetical protein
MQASRETSKRAFDILENSHDNREKLQAMELFKDTHIVKLGLLSNATLDSALNYIRNKQQGECSKGRYRTQLQRLQQTKPSSDNAHLNHSIPLIFYTYKLYSCFDLIH